MTPVKAWREYLRLTQAEVAARMGVTQSAYAQMEAVKRPRKVTLAKLAAALGLEVEQLNF
jgi:transcriptional regulator with XRE-family HTH domain